MEKEERKNIVILGAGEIGLSLGRILRLQGHRIKFWDKNPEVLEGLGSEQTGLPEIIPEADLVFLCVPSWAMREALLFVAPYLSKQAGVVSLAKGVEVNTLKTMDELVKNLLPKNHPFGLLSGMMIAEEIREGQYGAGVLATAHPNFGRQIKSLFAESNLAVEESSDLRGVALCGALKNIYSLALGISFGLNLGENVRGLLVTKAVVEMKKIVSLLGGKQDTVLGPAGLGDFVATGFSNFSKNHQVGEELADGRLSSSSEGLSSIEPVAILIGDKIKKFPLLNVLLQIVRKDIPAGQAFQGLLKEN